MQLLNTPSPPNNQPDHLADDLIEPGDLSQAMQFLNALDADGRHNLVAINAQGIEGRTFSPKDGNSIERWIAERRHACNLHPSINEPVFSAPNRKLAKTEIGQIRCVAVDLDLQGAEKAELDGSRTQLLAKVAELIDGPLPPSMVVDSGGGFHCYWLFDAKVLATELTVSQVEAQTRAIAVAVGGDTAVYDVARVLRLPGTMNFPNAKKREAGRIEQQARLHFLGDRRYTLDEIAAAYPPVGLSKAIDKSPEIAAAIEEIDMGFVTHASEFEDLDSSLSHKFLDACSSNQKLADLWANGRHGGSDPSASARRFALARLLKITGTFTPDEFGALLWIWPHSIGACDDLEDKITPREIGRAWGNVAVDKPFDAAEWFEPLLDNPTAPTLGAISWIDPRAWCGQPIAPREWEVEGWIPRREVTLLFGDGGIGKTLLAHQYATAAATGGSWLGQKTRQTRVMCFFCEDDADELHRRQSDINAALGVDYSDLAGLRITSRKHDENALGIWQQDKGKTLLTPAWHRLKDDAVAFGADVVIVDTLSDIFVGDEIKRIQANSFVKTCLGRLARDIGGSVIALGHPSKAGQTDGSGESGSTGWNNAVRSRLYLRYPDKAKTGDVREIENKKLNYGPKGSIIKMRWERGAFTPLSISSAAGASRGGLPGSLLPRMDDAADHAVLKAVNRCAGQRMTHVVNSSYFAPKVLLRLAEDDLRDLSESQVRHSFERLVRAGTISSAVVGKDSSRRAVFGYVIQTAKNATESRKEAASVFD